MVMTETERSIHGNKNLDETCRPPMDFLNINIFTLSEIVASLLIRQYSCQFRLCLRAVDETEFKILCSNERNIREKHYSHQFMNLKLIKTIQVIVCEINLANSRIYELAWHQCLIPDGTEPLTM